MSEKYWFFWCQCTIKIWRYTSARQRLSSCLFSRTFSSKGYLYSGKEAIGQSKAGISILWMYLLWVVERQPKVLPWKLPIDIKYFIKIPNWNETCFHSNKWLTFKGHNRVSRWARDLVHHTRFYLFLRERFALPLFLGVPDKNIFKSILIRTRTTHHCRNVW